MLHCPSESLQRVASVAILCFDATCWLPSCRQLCAAIFFFCLLSFNSSSLHQQINLQQCITNVLLLVVVMLLLSLVFSICVIVLWQITVIEAPVTLWDVHFFSWILYFFFFYSYFFHSIWNYRNVRMVRLHGMHDVTRECAKRQQPATQDERRRTPWDNTLACIQCSAASNMHMIPLWPNTANLHKCYLIHVVIELQQASMDAVVDMCVVCVSMLCAYAYIYIYVWTKSLSPFREIRKKKMIVLSLSLSLSLLHTRHSVIVRSLIG